MIDEAAKAARRAQIQNELQRLRHSRDDNTSARNRLNAQIEDLRTASHRLEGCIGRMTQIERRFEQCHNVVPIKEFAGGRRKRAESRLIATGGNVNRKIKRHESNLNRINRGINEFGANRDNLIATITTQNNRISDLERELRGLW